MIPNSDTVSQWTHEIYNMPIWLLCGVTAIIIGYMLRHWPKFPNWLIGPFLLLAGAIAVGVLAPDAPEKMPARIWRAQNALIGAIICGGGWWLHRPLIKMLENKIPWLKSLLGSSNGFDTAPPWKPDQATAVEPKTETKT